MPMIKHMPQKTFLLFGLISFVLVAIWFRQGIMIAKAEEGLPFYDLSRTFELYNSAFYDTDLGRIGVFNIPRAPLFFTFSVLSTIMIPSWLIQAGLFFVLNLAAMVFMKKSVDEISENKQYGFNAALFYSLNLFVISQVWSRFVLSLIFLWAYFPLFMYLWIKFLNTKKLRYLLYLIISTFAFSSMFVILSPLVTLWIAAFIFFVFKVVNSKDWSLILYAILAVAIWLISNIWWFYPVISSANSSHGASLDAAQNITSIKEVSTYFPIPEILTLRQSYLFGETSHYHEYYQDPKTVAVSVVILLVSVLGLLKARGNLAYFAVLAIISFIVVKGTNGILGNELYEFLFTKFPFTQIYRNPYEKFGVVYLFTYSTLFSIGLYYLSSAFGKYKKIISTSVLVCSCVYLVWPMWNGKLFNNTNYVIVPSYYKSANDYIENYSVPNTRILQLPFLYGSQIKYDWNYEGEEPSEFLFDKPSVSRTSSVDNFDQFYYKLGNTINFREEGNYANILALMNVEYIVLHNDVLKSTYHQEGYEDSKRYISQWNNVSYEQDFAKLSLHSVDKSILPGPVYLSNKVYCHGDLDSAFVRVASTEFSPKTDSFVIHNDSTDCKEFTGEIPEYKVNKLSEIHYEVEILDAFTPFVLILANNYSERWKAYIGEDLISDHFAINGYANGWKVENLNLLKIDIKFK